MVSFTSKSLDQDINFGKYLKLVRERKKMTVEDVSILLGISEKYLKAFEDQNVEEMPEGIYADKFLERYAAYLGLKIGSESVLINKRMKQDNLRQLSLPEDKLFIRVKNFILNPIFFKKMIICSILGATLIYLFSIAYAMVKAPYLKIINPADDFVTGQYTINIQGLAEEEAKVFINDKEVFASANGAFQESIDLKKGVNIVEISAKKKYSKENMAYRKILVTEGDAVSMK